MGYRNSTSVYNDCRYKQPRMALQLLRQNWRYSIIDGYILAAFCLITIHGKKVR